MSALVTARTLWKISRSLRQTAGERGCSLPERLEVWWACAPEERRRLVISLFPRRREWSNGEGLMPGQVSFSRFGSAPRERRRETMVRF